MSDFADQRIAMDMHDQNRRTGGRASFHELDLFFSQSLDGFFFMMLDEPIDWRSGGGKETLLDYAFAHQHITRINQALLKQYGATEAEFLGRTPADLFAHDLAHGRDLWRRMFDAGRLHTESEERRADGSHMWVEGDYICFHDDQGRITGHFGVQRDVTERKLAAEELERRVALRTSELNQASSQLHRTNAKLRESEDRLASVIRSTMDAIVVVDSTRCVVIFNAAAEKMFGFTATEAIGQAIDHCFPGPFGQLLITTIDSPNTTSGQVWMPEGLRATRKNGESFPAEATVSRADVSTGRLYTIILRDINERERAAEALDQLRRENVYLQEELQGDLPFFEEMIGASPRMAAVFSAVDMVAQTDSTVLLLGETGTGKELLARALHNRSRRKQGVMVKVNCAALPSNLVESELFGHERGAFTGAVTQKRGRFELAHRGTIFLDEIGELPFETQTKLLRVLQEQEFERVGGIQTQKVDVRVIAATNRDLEQEVRRGTFRSDLFYRLNVFPIEVPALRERPGDIPQLASHFVHKFAQHAGKRIHSIQRSVLEQLMDYDWPGNVRELANLMERAVIFCQGNTLQPKHLTLTRIPSATNAPAPEPLPTMEEAERRLILRALEQCNGVLAGASGAAAALGVNRSTLWSRMRKLGIDAPSRGQRH